MQYHNIENGPKLARTTQHHYLYNSIKLNQQVVLLNIYYNNLCLVTSNEDLVMAGVGFEMY